MEPEEQRESTGTGERPERFQQVMGLFDRAVLLEGAEREELLRRECAGDEALREEVEEMLGVAAAPEAGLTAGGGMSPSVAGRIVGRSAEDGAARALLPILRGEYRILGTLGHGGMGVVYRAEQSIPRRTVAIKAIRPGLTSRQVLRRFEQEAHILGRLHHPGIAQVYEAGAASSARADEAFFAMEFVDGVPITEYAKEAGLSVAERMEMMARVCDAVQHAHQRRVIHRDLKPGNILVTKEGQPKILDFGVARLEDGGEAFETATRQTHVGQLIGTLAYMAPEQLEGEEVDARADVYALGVILYQLLTGRLPLDFKGSSLLEAARLMRDVGPAKVSEVVPGLKGDVEIIVQKAGERDKERRYQTASDLAADIRRYLNGEPIQARADSAVYVIRKQLARHKGVTAAIIAAVLGLAAFSIYASVQSSREAAAKRQADANAERYRKELSVTSIERGRLLGLTGNFPVAEKLIWKEHVAEPTDLSYWALWELYSKMPVRATLAGHEKALIRVCASPRGDLAATVSGRDVLLWDTKTWASAGAVHFDSEVRGVQFSPDGAVLIGAGADGDVGVWNLGADVAGGPVTRMQVGKKIVGLATGAGGDGPWPVYVVGSDGSVAVLRLMGDGRLALDGALTTVAPTPVTEMNPIVVSPDGLLVAMGTLDGSVLVWRSDTRALVWRGEEHVGRVTSLAFSPDGSLLVSGGVDRTALFWDVSGMMISAAAQHMMQWDNGTIRSLDISPDGRHILASGWWRTEVWDIQKRAKAVGYTVCNETSGSAVWVDGGARILASGSESLARVWEARPDGHVRRITAYKDSVGGVAVSPKGDLLATSGNDGSLTLWKWPSMERVWDTAASRYRIRALAFSGDGGRLVSGGADGSVRVWDVATKECTLTIPLGGEYYATGFSPDGREVLTARRDNAVRLFDATTGALAETLTAVRDTDGVVAAVFSEDGKRVVAAHGQGMSVWEIATPGTMREARTTSSGWTLCWLGTERMAVGTWGGMIEVVDLQSVSSVRTLSGHTQVVTSLALGPDLKDGSPSLVSSSGDGFIKLWDPATGACLLTLNPGLGGVAKVVSSVDRRWLISGHLDGSLGVWDLSYYDPHIRAGAALQAESVGNGAARGGGV